MYLLETVTLSRIWWVFISGGPTGLLTSSCVGDSKSHLETSRGNHPHISTGQTLQSLIFDLGTVLINKEKLEHIVTEFLVCFCHYVFCLPCTPINGGKIQLLPQHVQETVPLTKASFTPSLNPGPPHRELSFHPREGVQCTAEDATQLTQLCR